MKTSSPFLSTLFCLLLLWVVSCKKTDDSTVMPGGTTTPGTTTKSSAKAISAFTLSALNPVVTATIDATAKTISATIASGTDLTKLVPTITLSDKATVSPASGVAQDFSKAITYTVTAEDGSTQAYIATVIVAVPVGVSSDQVVYYSASAFSNNVYTYSIKAVDALSGKELSTWVMGTKNYNDVSAPNVDTYPKLYDNGVLYAAQTKKMLAIDATTGKTKWTAALDDFSPSSSGGAEPMLANGLLFVSGSLGKTIYALNNTDGSQKWTFPYDQTIRTFTASNGLLYVGYGDINFNGGLMAIDISTGKEKWNLKTLGVYGNPALVNGVVYYGDAKKIVYAVDAATGTKKWEFLTGGIVYTSPTLSDGIVYIGSDDKKMYALDAATGAKKWEFLTTEQLSTYGSPFVENDNIYFSANGNKFYALDKKTGTKKWEVTPAIFDPVVVVNGLMYCRYATYDAASGTKKWEAANTPQSACVVIKGKVYASSNSGMVQ